VSSQAPLSRLVKHLRHARVARRSESGSNRSRSDPGRSRPVGEGREQTVVELHGNAGCTHAQGKVVLQTRYERVNRAQLKKLISKVDLNSIRTDTFHPLSTKIVLFSSKALSTRSRSSSRASRPKRARSCRPRRRPCLLDRKGRRQCLGPWTWSTRASSLPRWRGRTRELMDAGELTEETSVSK
jgi:hypothetical protein